MENKKGKILTVTSMKGGVGKTTTVMLLAHVYAKYGRKVLVIDLDLYNGNLAFAYNVKVKNNLYNLCDDLSNNRMRDDGFNDYLIEVDENIHLLASVKDPRQANKIDHHYIDNILKSLKYNYDVILIDTDKSLSVNNMVAFVNSDLLINVFTNDSFDLQGTRNFVAICKNMGVDNLVLLLNNAIDDRKKFYSLNDIKEVVKKNVDYTIPQFLHIKNYDRLVMDGKIKMFDEIFQNDKEFEDFAYHMFGLIDDERGNN